MVRENFQKVIDCRTLALGAEVYASDSGERKSFPHTCKSRPVQVADNGPRSNLRSKNYVITLTSRSITMQITSKGQVTIPQDVRNRLGLLPHTEVEFELAGDHARIRKPSVRPVRASEETECSKRSVALRTLA